VLYKPRHPRKHIGRVAAGARRLCPSICRLSVGYQGPGCGGVGGRLSGCQWAVAQSARHAPNLHGWSLEKPIPGQILGLAVLASADQWQRPFRAASNRNRTARPRHTESGQKRYQRQFGWGRLARDPAGPAPGWPMRSDMGAAP